LFSSFSFSLSLSQHISFSLITTTTTTTTTTTEAEDGSLSKEQFFKIYLIARKAAADRQLELREAFKKFENDRKIVKSADLVALFAALGVTVGENDLKVE
jgi:hypothetical protein